MNVPIRKARLIIDKPGAASWNMAVDAAILESLTPNSPPTLRFYQWSRPTLSLGYFQSLANRAAHAESQVLEVVRRSTGGGAIVHEHELTYSLSIATPTQRTGASHSMYRTVHDCIITALAEAGLKATRFGQNLGQKKSAEPFLCFQRRTEEDLIVSGYKVLGSAQRRGAHGILQHGSLLMAASTGAPQLPGLLELSSHSALQRLGVESTDRSGRGLVQMLATRLAAAFQVNWDSSGLSRTEFERAEQIEADRYGHPNWTERR